MINCNLLRVVRDRVQYAVCKKWKCSYNRMDLQDAVIRTWGIRVIAGKKTQTQFYIHLCRFCHQTRATIAQSARPPVESQFCRSRSRCTVTPLREGEHSVSPVVAVNPGHTGLNRPPVLPYSCQSGCKHDQLSWGKEQLLIK